MTPDREDHIESLCHAALALDPATRAAFLADMCGSDEELRREVASLLPYDEAVDQFLHVPSLDVPVQTAGGGHGRPGTGNSVQTAVHTLEAGARLGAYTVLSIIGAGGMGEVYRAHDPSLRRDVALKVLPDRFSRDTERLARFEREAQVLGSLSHPNIATIHGIERVRGISALVLELVEGATLADRLRRGPLPVDEALDIAHQIASALEAAHERGVVHRDLKPANVIVTPEGHVKLLDFGVAKVFDNVSIPGVLGAAGGQASEETRPGLAPGTAAYMSPEQVRGDGIDRRSDIWAFGCVLFEMLTGISPFHGATVAESLANVVSRPVDFARLPPATPVATRRLLRLCLERSPRGRLQHIGDARVDIGHTRAHRDEERASTPPSPGLTQGVSSRRAARRVTVGATVAALAAGAGWLAAVRSTPVPPAPVMRFSIVPDGPAMPSTARSVAISPDGARLAYVAGGWVWLRELGAAEAVRVPGTENGGGEPFFSPDGQWLAFFDVNTGLRKVRVAGGAPLTVLVNAGRQLGGSWGADGTIVFADGVGLFAVGADGGKLQLLARPAAGRGEVRYAWPQILPGGRAVLFTILRDTIANAELAVLDLETKRHKVLLRGGHAARFLASGHLVYAAGGRLQAALLDLDSLELRREPVGIDAVRMAETVGAATADFDVSETGTLIYVAPTQQSLRTLVWIDRRGREEAVSAEPNYYVYPRISPDGTRVALDVAGANRDIWVWNFVREIMTRITDGPTEDMMPAWSADGARVFFASDPEGVFSVFARAADGSAPATLVHRGPDNYMPFFAADAGRLLIFSQGPTAPSGDVSILNLQKPTAVAPLIRTPYREGNAQVSPDGRWVAYQSDESGRVEIYVRSFPDVDRRKELISRGGGTQPLWGSAGSGELFYRSLDGTVRSVSIGLTSELTVGTTTDLFADGSYAGSTVGSWSYAVSHRDNRLLMLKEQRAANVRPLNVVVNWHEELKRLVPTR